MTTNIRRISLLGVCLLLAPTLVRAQMAEAAGQDREPALRIEAGGPTAYVTSLVFGANDKALYAAGYDKLVHAWNLDREGKFAAGRDAYRVPLGPGVTGSINSIALSSDGTWLAVASRGVVRGTASFRQLGIYVPSVAVMSPEMWEDQGAIIVYNTAAPATPASCAVIAAGSPRWRSLPRASAARRSSPLSHASFRRRSSSARSASGTRPTARRSPT